MLPVTKNNVHWLNFSYQEHCWCTPDKSKQPNRTAVYKIYLYHITCWEPFKTCWQLGIRKCLAEFIRYFCLWPFFLQYRGIIYSFFPIHKCHSSPHAPTLLFLILRENYSKHNFIYQNTLCIVTIPEQTEQAKNLHSAPMLLSLAQTLLV